MKLMVMRSTWRGKEEEEEERVEMSEVEGGARN
jgi:hypothetical protein